jgi:hypothetical protein|tara:strand:+ start:13813 stop:14097 length:285 start_codon:yes stop_codon:yes gene_type:complete
VFSKFRKTKSAGVFAQGNVYRAVTPVRANKKKISPVTPLSRSSYTFKKDGSLVSSAANYGYVFSKKASKSFSKLGFLVINYRQKKLSRKYKLAL